MSLKEWLLVMASSFEDAVRLCREDVEIITVSNELALQIAESARIYAKELGD